jgi:ribosomal small subunit protein bTHX
MQTLLLLPRKRNLFMGKGDKKSKKGKIWRDSYGNSRRKKLIKAKLKRSASKKTTAAASADAKPKKAAKKA